jgi:glutathione synthase/RimK-type ligase-like ATP-grasp enzyme
MRIALATCKKLPEPDVDEEPLVRALEEAGANVRLLPWDGAEAEAGELVVLRSTWNYFEDVERFLAWVDRAAARTRVLNPPAVVRANARKTYLGELEARGVPIVPTAYVGRDEAVSLEDLVRRRGWEATALVVKPVVSAGSFLTRRFEPGDLVEAQRFLDEMGRAERDAMIQPWMAAVDTRGERALVWLDGEHSHAVRKAPRFAGGSESVTAVPIAPEEHAFAARVLAGARDRGLLYARVDVIEDAGLEGGLRLMELELIEPSLFFAQHPSTLDRFVQAIVAHARAGA